jgi:hypothetical protein
MHIEGAGVEIRVNPAEQSDAWLLGAAQEITDVARQRGLGLPLVVGGLAVDATRAAWPTYEAPPLTTKESIANQLLFSWVGYQAVVNSLNRGRSPKDLLAIATEETLITEFDDRLTTEHLNHIAAAQEADHELWYYLVATPNLLVTPRDVARAAWIFSEDQPYLACVEETFAREYTSEQVSGTHPENGKSVVFSLVSNKHGPDVRRNVRETSFLEDVTYWQTLRATGHKLVGPGTLALTYSRKADLPERLFDGVPFALHSCIDDDGAPIMGYTDARINSSYRDVLR